MDTENFVTHTLRADGFDASEDGTGRGTPLVACTLQASNGGVSSGYHPVIPVDMRQASRGGTMTNNRPEGSSGGAPGTGIGEDGDPAPSLSLSHPPAVAYQCHGSDIGHMGTLRSGNGNTAGGVPFVAQAFAENQRNEVRELAVAGAVSSIRRGDAKNESLILQSRVRRLTPVECEKLQGFPPGWTDVPYRGKSAADGNRYKAIGNSMAVPVMRWLGERIMAVDKIPLLDRKQ